MLAFSTAQAHKAKRPTSNSKLDATGAGGSRKRRRESSVEHEKQQKLREVQQMDREYQQLMRQVNELGAAQFTGKAKKDWQAREDALLGRRTQKEAKMPYVMLQGIRKKAKQREERREGMEAEAGVITGKAVGSARRASAATNRARGGGGQRGSDSSRGGNGRSSSAGFGPAPSMGMMKSGVLHISRNSAPPGVRKRMSVQGHSGCGGGGGKGKSRSGGAGAGRGGRR